MQTYFKIIQNYNILWNIQCVRTGLYLNSWGNLHVLLEEYQWSGWPEICYDSAWFERCLTLRRGWLLARSLLDHTTGLHSMLSGMPAVLPQCLHKMDWSGRSSANTYDTVLTTVQRGNRYVYHRWVSGGLKSQLSRHNRAVLTRKNSWETRPSGGKRAPNPSAGNILSL